MKRTGRCLFAASLVIFGVQHLFYFHVIASLMPGWMPGRPLLAGLTGVGFLAAGAELCGVQSNAAGGNSAGANVPFLNGAASWFAHNSRAA